jgi:Concanavalin A-like lectin/glucanases superfamily
MGGVAQSAGTAGSSSGVSGSLTGSMGGDPTPSGGEGGAGGAGGEPTSSGGEGGAVAVPDECPDDPGKTAPGVCGCGFPDVATATLASCTTLKSKLIHRYDFEGTGTTVTDRVGTAHGAIVGGATLSKLTGRGVVVLAGGTTGSYVNLPNKLASSLTNATFEAWITWGGGNNYQRVFDFGDSDSATPEDNPANGKTYLFVSPQTASGFVSLGYSLMGNAGGAEQHLDGTAPLPQALSQVVAVADAAGGTLSLYVNGVQVGTRAWTGALSSINDVNVWLGRSQYNGDPELTATYHDFRIYNAALSALEIATAFRGGTDPSFLPH